MNWPDFVETVTVGNIITWVTFIAACVVLVRKVTPVFKTLADLLDDFKGEKARPGVKARPGIMERLEKLEDTGLVIMDVRDKLEHMDKSNINVAKEVQRLATIQGKNVRNIRDANRRVQRVETMLMQHVHDSKVWIDDLARNAEHYNFKVPDWPVRPQDPWLHDDDEDDDTNTVD